MLEKKKSGELHCPLYEKVRVADKLVIRQVRKQSRMATQHVGSSGGD